MENIVGNGWFKPQDSDNLKNAGLEDAGHRTQDTGHRTQDI
jgi:hypothetical protein